MGDSEWAMAKAKVGNRNRKAKSSPLPAISEMPARTQQNTIFHLELCRGLRIAANLGQAHSEGSPPGFLLESNLTWCVKKLEKANTLTSTFRFQDFFQKEITQHPEESCRPSPHITIIPKSEKRAAPLRTNGDDIAKL